jgi:ATP phosphoribosyltransferase regulatory subunit
VLHTLPNGMNRTREPLQIGAEIYGHAGIESDVEIQQLMLRSLAAVGIEEVHLDIGHVGIFRALVSRAKLARETESELFRAMQMKDAPAVRELTTKLPRAAADAFALLPELYGGPEVLKDARRLLPSHPEIGRALDDLEALSQRLRDIAHIRCFDLAELRGYAYHSGVVFAAYAKGQSWAVGRGGRYDEVGKAFGRARPATGFSMDLRELASLSPGGDGPRGVLAPYKPDDADLQRRIALLRGRGTPVVVELPGHSDGVIGCERRLVRRKGKWLLEKL